MLAADRDKGALALPIAAVVMLLLHNALRVDGACAADIADLGDNAGRWVLRVVRKSSRTAKIPAAPATVAALDAYFADPAQRAGLGSGGNWRGRFWAPANGGRLRRGIRQAVNTSW